MPCRIRRSLEWKIRLMAELENWSCSMFTTLTYSEDHLPKNGLLNKRDVQLFLKKLRKKYNKKIKYYMAGEYGEENHRPHYHFIFFGIGTSDINYISKYNNDLIPIWDKANIVHCGRVEPDSIQYVTKYITYKDSRNKVPAFSLMSKNLGESLLHHKDFKNMFWIKLQNGSKVLLPRYYRKKLEITDEENIEEFGLYDNFTIYSMNKLNNHNPNSKEIVEHSQITYENHLTAIAKDFEARLEKKLFRRPL